MSAEIRRYQIQKTTCSVGMPDNAKLLYADLQRGKVWLHAVVEAKFDVLARKIYVVKTGSHAETIVGLPYIGSVAVPDNDGCIDTLHMFDGGYTRPKVG